MFYNVACCYIYFCFYLDTKDFTIIKNNNKVKHNITLKGYKFAQLFAQLFAHVRTDMYICKRNI